MEQRAWQRSMTHLKERLLFFAGLRVTLGVRADNIWMQERGNGQCCGRRWGSRLKGNDAGLEVVEVGRGCGLRFALLAGDAQGFEIVQFCFRACVVRHIRDRYLQARNDGIVNPCPNRSEIARNRSMTAPTLLHETSEPKSPLMSPSEPKMFGFSVPSRSLEDFLLYSSDLHRDNEATSIPKRPPPAALPSPSPTITTPPIVEATTNAAKMEGDDELKPNWFSSRDRFRQPEKQSNVPSRLGNQPQSAVPQNLVGKKKLGVPPPTQSPIPSISTEKPLSAVSSRLALPRSSSLPQNPGNPRTLGTSKAQRPIAPLKTGDSRRPAFLPRTGKRQASGPPVRNITRSNIPAHLQVPPVQPTAMPSSPRWGFPGRRVASNLSALSYDSISSVPTVRTSTSSSILSTSSFSSGTALLRPTPLREVSTTTDADADADDASTFTSHISFTSSPDPHFVHITVPSTLQCMFFAYLEHTLVTALSAFFNNHASALSSTMLQAIADDWNKQKVIMPGSATSHALPLPHNFMFPLKHQCKLFRASWKQLQEDLCREGLEPEAVFRTFWEVERRLEDRNFLMPDWLLVASFRSSEKVLRCIGERYYEGKRLRAWWIKVAEVIYHSDDMPEDAVSDDDDYEDDSDDDAESVDTVTQAGSPNGSPDLRPDRVFTLPNIPYQGRTAAENIAAYHQRTSFQSMEGRMEDASDHENSDGETIREATIPHLKPLKISHIAPLAGHAPPRNPGPSMELPFNPHMPPPAESGAPYTHLNEGERSELVFDADAPAATLERIRAEHELLAELGVLGPSEAFGGNVSWENIEDRSRDSRKRESWQEAMDDW